MEITKFNLSFEQLSASLRRRKEEGLSPDVMWRVILSLGVCSLAVAAVFAYLTYGWATSIDTSIVPQKTDRSTLSPSELKSVIAIYEEKERQYRELLTTSPIAPSYKKRQVVAPQLEAAGSASTSDAKATTSSQ